MSLPTRPARLRSLVLRTCLLKMSLIISRRHKRSIALAMLFVWVFALLSGIANACYTQSRSEAQHSGTHLSQGNHLAQLAWQSHVADQAQDGDHHAKAPCQKSCDATSQTLLKQLPKFDNSDLQVLIPAIHRQVSDLHMAPAALVRAALAAVLPPSPPMRVQFSRLAL